MRGKEGKGDRALTSRRVSGFSAIISGMGLSTWWAWPILLWAAMRSLY